MTKPTKAESNRNNALKSTGPKSAAGKATSAQNSLSHGLLSTHLILENENREDFDALLDELQLEFETEGLLEMSLVERIAIALWRQRRLVRAESAQIELQKSISRIDAIDDICRALTLKPLDPRVGKEWEGVESVTNNFTTKELFKNIYVLRNIIDKNWK